MRPGASPPQGSQLKPLWFKTGEGKFDCIMTLPGISNGSVTEVSSPDLTGEIIASTQFIVRERVK
ncbi:MAG: hypothetical protein LBQ46_13700 [Treponema sp.]|nr:hypothetical protein [Treponema sp.]